MSTFDIATGQSLDLSPSPPQDRPPVAPPTQAYPPQPSRPGEQGGVADTMQQQRLAEYRGDVATAQAAGQGDKAALNAKYETSMLPLGASAGDLLPLPPVISDWSKHTGGSDATSYDPAG